MCTKNLSETSFNVEPENQEDFSCTYCKKWAAHKLDFDEILSRQPIGIELFKQFCSETDKKWLVFFEILLIYRKTGLSRTEDKKRVIDLIENNMPKNVYDSKVTTALVKQARVLIKNNINMEKFVRFSEEVHLWLSEQVYEDFRKTSYFYRFMMFKHLECSKGTHGGFKIGRKLTEGFYGSLYACKSTVTGSPFLLDELYKSNIARSKIECIIENEKNILDQLNSRFVISLISVYEKKNSICIIMSNMIGGNLRTHLNLNKYGFDINRAKFYICEIICGLVYLHSKDILHFNIKPESIVMDENGHVRISDFGFAGFSKKPHKLRGFVKIDNYTAPELYKNEPVHFAADWFSLGCVFYEMIEGKPPFERLCLRNSSFNLRKSIVNKRVMYSDKFDRDSVNLCEMLLEKNQHERFVYNVGGVLAKNLKQHSFFTRINWKNIENGETMPPFVPNPHINYYDSQYIERPATSRLDDWEPTKKNLKFYKRFCTGAHSINWQMDIIESKCLDMNL